jgi:hypothetical protein
MKGILTTTPRRSKCHKHTLFPTNNLRKFGIVKHLNSTWCLDSSLYLYSGLLSDESRQAVQISSSIIILWVLASSIEPLQCWETLDSEFASEGFVFVCVYFGDDELVLGMLEVLG